MAAEIRDRLLTWLALLALLALTVALSFAPLGPLRLAVSLLIAAAKAGLIYWVFMDLRKADALIRVAAVAAVLFLGILMLLPVIDFTIRAASR